MPIPKCDGISLRPFIEGTPVEHDVVSYSSGTRTPNYMIRSGNLKLMMAEKARNRSVDALYDLRSDPHEMRNLLVAPAALEENREQAKNMKSRLVRWLQQHEPHKVDDLKARR